MNKFLWLKTLFGVIAIFLFILIWVIPVFGATHITHYVTDLDENYIASSDMIVNDGYIRSGGQIINFTECAIHFSEVQNYYEPSGWAITDGTNPGGGVHCYDWGGYSNYGFADVLILTDSGANQYIATYPFSGLRRNGTIEFWMMIYDSTAFDDNDVDSYFFISNVDGNFLFGLRISGNTRVMSFYKNGGWVSSNQLIPIGIWHHIQLDFDSYNYTFYMDDKQFDSGAYYHNFAGGFYSLTFQTTSAGFGDNIIVDCFDFSWSPGYYLHRIVNFEAFRTSYYQTYLQLAGTANYHYLYNITFDKNVEGSYISFRYRYSENNITYSEWSSISFSSVIDVYRLIGEYLYIEFNMSASFNAIQVGNLILRYYYTNDYYDSAFTIWDKMMPIISASAVLFIVPILIHSDKKLRFLVFPFFIIMLFVAFFSQLINQLIFMILLIISIIILILKYRRGELSFS